MFFAKQLLDISVQFVFCQNVRRLVQFITGYVLNKLSFFSIVVYYILFILVLK